ncbi:MAG: hypothetical protein GY737_03175 [Desulfobacteraceae bacterium]|nr:hypothetical protein [Desulfobacteraceae bacterium]
MSDYFFKMEGHSFDKGLPIDIVANSLAGLQNVFDGSYKAITGKSKISKKDRTKFRLIASDFKHSSFISNFDLVTTGIQMGLPFVGVLSLNEFWSNTKNAYDFLKALYTVTHESKPSNEKGKFSSKIQNNSNGSMTIQNGDNHTTYNAPVVQVGKLIINGVRDLDDILDKDKIETIELGETNTSSTIVLNSSQKGLFKAPVLLSEEPEILDGEIYDFNKYEKEGRIKIFENQSIENDTYKFKVIGGQNIHTYIMSMAATKVRIRCIIEYLYDPLIETKISKLLVTEIMA